MVFTAGVLLIAWVKERQKADKFNNSIKCPSAHQFEGENKNELIQRKLGDTKPTNAVNKLPLQSTALEVVGKKNYKTNDKTDDRLAGILLENIDTQMYDIRPLVGKEHVRSTMSKHEYQIDLGKQTCTCDYFSKKAHFPLNDARRFCYHMIEAFERYEAFKNVPHRTLMVAELGSAWHITSAYSLKHVKLPLMYLLVEKANPWLNIFARKKRSGESVYSASGDFERHSYNILQERWSYGEGVPGASILKPFFQSITTLEHIDNVVDQVTRRSPPRTLSQKSDPRLNPDKNSDQFGPKHDHYETPESRLRSEHPCECSLLFSYSDGQKQNSRRTVDFKKLQFYGSEGSFLYGECRMRRDGRTFNTSKMTNVMDVTTGEIIDNVTEFATNLWSQSTKARLREWEKQNERIAKAFLFLLKGNKRATKSDYKALSTIFSELLDGASVNTSDVQFLYEGQDPTTAVGFQRLVGGILKHHPEQTEWFKRNAIKLGNARAKPNFADQAAIEYVIKRIP